MYQSYYQILRIKNKLKNCEMKHFICPFYTPNLFFPESVAWWATKIKRPWSPMCFSASVYYSSKVLCRFLISMKHDYEFSPFPQQHIFRWMILFWMLNAFVGCWWELKSSKMLSLDLFHFSLLHCLFHELWSQRTRGEIDSSFVGQAQAIQAC